MLRRLELREHDLGALGELAAEDRGVGPAVEVPGASGARAVLAGDGLEVGPALLDPEGAGDGRAEGEVRVGGRGLEVGVPLLESCVERVLQRVGDEDVGGEAASEPATQRVEIQGSREQDEKGFLAKRASSATKTDTPIMETPHAVTVITNAQMTAQGVETVEQALRYTAGVMTEVTGYDLRYQSLVIRGFAPAMYRDGMRVFASGSYGDWQVDPQGVERLEVLKGPASVLYGQGSPGGLVNQVSKRATPDAVREVGLTIGNHDRYQATADVGGAITDELSFRINALVRDSKTQTDFSKDNRVFIAPTLTWRPSAATSFTLLADVTQDRATPKSWWPDRALLDPHPGGRLPVSRFLGEPGFDHYNRDMASLGYLFEHVTDSGWTLRQNLRYSRFKLDYQHIYGNDFIDDNTISRGSLVSRTQGNAVTLDNQAQTHVNWGGLDQKLLFGVDYQRFSGYEDLGFGDAPNLDVYNPVYGQPFDAPTTDRSLSKLRQLGVYAQDQMKVGGWILNAGLRHDRAVTNNSGGGFSLTQRDQKTTVDLGVMRDIGGGFAPYASFSTSFEPDIDGTAYDSPSNPLGNPLKPQTGRQAEAGIKYQPTGSDMLFTASVFDLRKRNVTTDDLDNPGYYVQTGEIRVRGVELEATVAMTRQLDLVAGITRLDPKVTASNDPTELGHEPVQIARSTAKLWVDAKLNGVTEGLSVGGGVRYVGKVAADAGNTYFNPGYTLFDAAVRYTRGPVTLSLNGANLFNHIYYANRAQFYGQTRTVLGTMIYRW